MEQPTVLNGETITQTGNKKAKLLITLTIILAAVLLSGCETNQQSSPVLSPQTPGQAAEPDPAIARLRHNGGRGRAPVVPGR